MILGHFILHPVLSDNSFIGVFFIQDKTFYIEGKVTNLLPISYSTFSKYLLYLCLKNLFIIHTLWKLISFRAKPLKRTFNFIVNVVFQTLSQTVFRILITIIIQLKSSIEVKYQNSCHFTPYILSLYQIPGLCIGQA